MDSLKNKRDNLPKYKKSLDKIMYLRGNTDAIEVRCPHCNKVFYKNSPKQIVYFCSKQCRRDFKPAKFEVVK